MEWLAVFVHVVVRQWEVRLGLTDPAEVLLPTLTLNNSSVCRDFMNRMGGATWINGIFPTVEKRAKLYDADNYTAIPDGEGMAAALYGELGLQDSSNVYVAGRDSCNKYDQKPVFSVPVASGTLWPVLVAEQYGLLYCCLPLVEQGSHTRPPLVNIPGLSSGFNLLLGMADFLGPLPRVIDESNSKLSELYLFVGEAAPLGTPLDTNPSTVRMALQGKYSPSPPSQAQKQPAWRPQQHKGKQHLQFTIRENIRARQYDQPSVTDTWDVHGVVTCKAELEGNMPEVTLTLGKEADLSDTIIMDHVLVHPCVQSIEPQGVGAVQDEGGQVSTCRLRFTPPLEQFTLCHYTADSLPQPPVQGFYQMKGEKTVEVLIQLKLTDHTKNSFEYCELQLPFHHRGPIINHESAPNHGSVLVSPDKKVLVWNIGQKFPSRSLEVLLKSTVHFGKYEPPAPEAASAEETFCTGQNCFAQGKQQPGLDTEDCGNSVQAPKIVPLFFKVPDFTMSGVTVDTKSIQVSPNVRYKLTFGRELISTDYKIWNSHGNSPTAYQPSPLLLAKMQNVEYKFS